MAKRQAPSTVVCWQRSKEDQPDQQVQRIAQFTPDTVQPMPSNSGQNQEQLDICRHAVKWVPRSKVNNRRTCVGRDDRSSIRCSVIGWSCRSAHYLQSFRQQRWKNHCATGFGSRQPISQRAPQEPKETLSCYDLSASVCLAFKTSSAQMLWCSRAHCSSTSPLPIASNAPSIPTEPR